MEANRKVRKGFIKGKLVMSLYRATQPYNNKPKSNYTNSLEQPTKQSSTTSVGFIVNQEKVNPKPKPKVSFMLPAVEYSKFDNPYGVMGDEGVDAKAASYISSVQERFKLERLNSERQRAESELR